MIHAVHPAALFGLLAALVPIAIYLLLRRRRTQVRWGASYLLRLTLASKRRASIWRQIVVLAVRCLILVLAAVLLAQLLHRNDRPSATTPELPASPVHRVLLIDNSLSMSFQENERSRADAMRAAIGYLLRSQRPCDTSTVIPLLPDAAGGRPVAAVLAGKLREREIDDVTSGIRLREGTTDLAPALAEALSRLSSTPRAAAEIYIFSDFPRDLSGPGARLDWFRAAAAERGVRVVPVNLAGDEAMAANVSVRDARLGSDLAVAGVPMTLYADVENFSDTDTVGRLEITQDGRALPPAAVALQPNERRSVASTVTFASPGVSVLKLAAGGSRLALDTSSYLAVEVRQAPAVWVLAAKAAGFSGGSISESEFLLRALRQKGSGGAALAVEEAEPRAFAQPIPENVDVILIAGVALNGPLGATLAAFVRRGGGLIVALSPDVKAAAYNESLGELLPAELDKPWRESVDPEVYLTVSPTPREGASPLFQEFATDRNGTLNDARIYNFMRVRNLEDAPGVVLGLSSGDPFLLHKPVGRGHVYLLTTSFGISWSSLAVQQTHLPLLYRLVGAAMAGRGFPRNLAPGTRFAAPWPAGEKATLVTPFQEEDPLAVVPGLLGSFVVVEQTARRGLYRLKGGSREEAFTVTGAFPESDLRSLLPAQSDALAGALGAPIYRGWARAVEALGPIDRMRPLWPWLLAALLGLYLFEAWFVRSL